MKNQKGITLIALVITIIVLLILAGITIAMLAGENGILTNATKSKAYDEIGTAKDQINLKANEAISTYFETTYVGSSATGTYSNANVRNAVAEAVAGLNLTSMKTAPAELENGKIKTGTTPGYTINLQVGDYEVNGVINTNGSIKWGDIGYQSGKGTPTATTPTVE